MNAIFFKEWIKTRWYLLLACIVTLGFVIFNIFLGEFSIFQLGR